MSEDEKNKLELLQRQVEELTMMNEHLYFVRNKRQ